MQIQGLLPKYITINTGVSFLGSKITSLIKDLIVCIKYCKNFVSKHNNNVITSFVTSGSKQKNNSWGILKMNKPVTFLYILINVSLILNLGLEFSLFLISMSIDKTS